MYLLINKINVIFRYLPMITFGEITSASKGFNYIYHNQISINSQVKIVIINVFPTKHVTYLVLHIY